MKHRLRRLLSLLLAVCIVLSLLTGMLLTVSAAANQGVRHVTCTQLSSAAQSYYTGSYSYATLKATSGASDTSTSYNAKQNNSLYTALYNLMSSTHTNTNVVYSGTASPSLAYYWTETDANNGSSTYLYFYTDILASDSSVTSVTMNREHIWPQSHASYYRLGGGADLHHLRPSISGVNQSKSNRVFANLNGAGSAYQVNSQDVIWTGSKDNITDGVLEVRDNVKGDVARILLYVYVRWQQPNLYSDVATSLLPTPDSDDDPTTGNTGIRAIESLSTLLDWMQTDPVDNWEMGRNDAIESVQGNRNVFIDYPELAWYLFGITPPPTMTTPSGDAANNGASYEITSVNVNNPSYGTATITNSNTVTVTPAAGYYVQSATSTSGTVSINGNVITVSGLTANATVSVVLAQSVTYTISFSVPAGVTQASITGAENSSFLLPTPTGSPTTNAHNYEFLGWVSNSVSDTTTQPSFLSPGTSYTITGNATLIALYRYPDETVSGNYVKVTSDSELTDGQYLIVNGDAGRAMDASKEIAIGTGTNYVAVTISNDAIESTATVDGYAFTYDATAGTFATPGGLYICRTSGDTGGAVETTSTASEAANTVSISDGSASIVCGTYYLRYNSNGYFRYYTSASQKAIQLYKQESGANHYTTVLLNACSHSYGTAVSNNDGTHSKTCTLCNNVVTEPCNYTATTSGTTTTYTCSDCHYSYTETLNSYTISYNVCGAVTSTVTVTQGNSVNLITAPAYTGYTFVGWATSAITPETATVPTTLTGSYTPTASITLYAVYSRLVQGGGSPVYTLVSSIANGDRVIIYNPGNGKAVKASMNGYYVAGADVTPASSVISDPSDAAVWTVAANQNGTYTFTSGSNELSADSTTSGSNTYNNLYVVTGHKNMWTLATCNAANNTFFVYNAQMTASNDHIYLEWYANKSGFSAYDSSTATESNYGFQFYKYGSGDATYYTTQPTVPCAHTNTTLTGAVAATCTTAGYTGDDVCDSCGAVVTAGTTIPALGHSYGGWASNNNGTHSKTCSVCQNVVTESCNYTASTSGATTTYTCSDCRYSYTVTLSTWTITYLTCGVASEVSCIDGSSATFPSRDGVNIGGTEYAFVGWVASTVEATTTRPATIYEAGTDFTPQADATYYALYSSSTDGTPYDEYRLVTDPSDLAENVNVVIAARNSNYAISQNNSSITRTGVNKGSDTLTINSATVYTLERGSDSGAWRFKTGSYYLAVNDSSITGVNSASIATSWKILSIDSSNGGTVMTAKTSSNSSDRYLRYSSSSFSTSSRSANSICLYKKNTVTPQIDSYTTELNLHTHTPVTDAAVAPTCTQTGLTAGSHCSVCNAVLTAQEVVPATGHTPVTDAAVAPTCTQTGLTAGSHCSVCNAVLTAQEVVPATGHTPVTDAAVAPTCTQTGLTAGSHCSVCNAVLTAQEVVPATGHTSSYVDNGNGTHDEVCSVCKEVLKDNEAHVFSNGVCSHCGVAEHVLRLVSAAPVLSDKIDMIYAAEVPEGYSNPYVIFTFHGVSTSPVTASGTDENSRLLFVFNDINPQCMGDVITATLYATNASVQESVSVTNYSVRQYCVNKLADKTIPDTLRNLLLSLLAYGAAAQTYTGHNPTALVTSGDDIGNPIYPAFSAVSGYAASLTDPVTSDVRWISAGLTLTNSVAMNFRFYAESIANLSVTLTFNGATRTIDEFASVGGGVYEFSFTDIQANEFGIPATVRFTRNGAPAGNALSYSVNSYVQSKQNDSSTANLAALVRALYVYGACAEAYSG